MFAFNHFNFNVTDLERSIAFYHDALGLEPVRRKEAADGSFILTFLGDGKTEFQLELPPAVFPIPIGRKKPERLLVPAGNYVAGAARFAPLRASPSVKPAPVGVPLRPDPP